MTNRFVSLVVMATSVFATAAPLQPMASMELAKERASSTLLCPARSRVALQTKAGFVLGQLKVVAGKPVYAELFRSTSAPGYPLAFSRDCTQLVVGAGSGQGASFTAQLWQLEPKPKPVGEPIVLSLPGSGTAFSDDGRFFALASNAGDLQVFAVSGSGVKLATTGPALQKGDQYLRLAWQKDQLLAGTYRGYVKRFVIDANGSLGAPTTLLDPTAPTRAEGSLSLSTGKVVTPGGARVFGVKLLDDGKRALAIVESGHVFSWDLTQSPATRSTLLEGLDGGSELALSSDGKWLMAADNFKARVWKLNAGKPGGSGVELGGLIHAGEYVSVHGADFFGNLLVLGTMDLDHVVLNAWLLEGKLKL